MIFGRVMLYITLSSPNSCVVFPMLKRYNSVGVLKGFFLIKKKKLTPLIFKENHWRFFHHFHFIRSFFELFYFVTFQFPSKELQNLPLTTGPYQLEQCLTINVHSKWTIVEYLGVIVMMQL
jgi:hypothetical protein